nr:peptidase S10 [Acidobacteriota bacterium]NIO58707.1 peptidase S10 [Acidobacteriota bacterium]NIQ31274.1 peptidase S10 [Acidobacteriota bacterium]NIQ84480.1 peptidase S10 [Acidobacteriota bacterium]
MADDAEKKNDTKAEAEAENDAAETPEHHEEGVVETTHEVVIGEQTVEYTAAAGRMILREEEGKKKASFFFTSYTRNGVEDPATRPIVFSFNGGPGSSSVWLHLGAFGPRRVLMDDEGFRVRPPGRLVDNEYSILD